LSQDHGIVSGVNTKYDIQSNVNNIVQSSQ